MTLGAVDHAQSTGRDAALIANTCFRLVCSFLTCPSKAALALHCAARATNIATTKPTLTFVFFFTLADRHTLFALRIDFLIIKRARSNSSRLI
jgi:hypothetical protein